LKRLIVLTLLACLASCGPAPQATPDYSADLKVVVKHYYGLFDRARATGNAALIEEATDDDGYDRANVQALLLEQMSKHKLSVIKGERFANWKVTLDGATAVVYFDYVATGYDVDALTHRPLEPESTLPSDRVRMELRRHAGHWLVFSRTRP
jgi:hypothetical protein